MIGTESCPLAFPVILAMIGGPSDVPETDIASPRCMDGAMLWSMTVMTRHLTSEDWSAFWPMLKDMGTDDDEPTAKERYGRLIHDRGWGVIGAVDGVSLVGYAAVQDYGTHLRLGDLHRIARLHDLYVAPDARLQGVGTALVEGAKNWASQRARYLEWQAGATTSAPFYEHLGYRGEPCPQPEAPTFVIDFRS